MTAIPTAPCRSLAGFRRRIWTREGSLLFAASLAMWVSGCGSRTPIDQPGPELEDPPPAERCDGRDTDGDGLVDEGFRSPDGHYLEDEHCGGCGRACDALRPNATAMSCLWDGQAAACAATACQPGFGLSTTGGCAALAERLCLPCVDDAFCGVLDGARCAPVGGDARCVIDCRQPCPSGYRCGVDDNGDEACLPRGGGCVCGPDDRFERACMLADGDPECPGRQRCEAGRLGECVSPEEICDGIDNDCDGEADEAFVNGVGGYAADAHCGACGIDCGLETASGPELECGGDPFAPSCVVRCPDRADGVQVGDRLDADGRIDTGCECTVVALTDTVGSGVRGQLDENCDGADGDVLGSYYVAVDGDDSGPGSPTRPLRTIGEAVRRAADSLADERPRGDVYVASGTYTESVEMLDGVRLHGGYRRDFLARDPDGLEVVVVAPADTDAPGGAAMYVRDAGGQPTLIEGMSLRGRDAQGAGEPALGVVVERPGARLALRDLRIQSGRPGTGEGGAAGAAGRASTREAGTGQAPHAARETPSHLCIGSQDNRAAGGLGGESRCVGVDVSGGMGGSARCPVFGGASEAGQMGRGTAAAPGGPGGAGGHHVEGPIVGGASCPSPPCCGLADFSVPTAFQQPRPGQAGADGATGSPGRACGDAFGRFAATSWSGGLATAGTSGRPGGGGGGGGAGGGAEMNWMTGCEFADGFGGGGGGGGGGCGGAAGAQGASGAPSVALLIVLGRTAALPRVSAVELSTQAGAAGGDGGNGGDGGLGGSGGFGGSLPLEERAIPTLAGPSSGQRGGRGGNGGGGGGGGGGCGGASVGIWVAGASPGGSVDEGALRASNVFALGEGGRAGRGGGGAAPAPAGLEGGVSDVLVR